MSRPRKKPVEHTGDIMPLDIQSPIIRIRMKKGLSQASMGLVLDISAEMITCLEEGKAKLDEKAQEAFTKFGFDGPELAKEQEEFIEKKRKWSLKHLRDNLL